MQLFDERGDYELFVRQLIAALVSEPIHLFAYCVMPNHFHLILRPVHDGQMAHFMKILTGSHSQAWHRARGTVGGGTLYQGRYRACPVQTSAYFFTACRYVERNALRAKLVARAEDWPWGSAARYSKNCQPVPLSEWPILPPDSWCDLVNSEQPLSEAVQVRQCTSRGLPLGDEDWQALAARDLDLRSKLRGRGRPRSDAEKGVGSLFP